MGGAPFRSRPVSRVKQARVVRRLDLAEVARQTEIPLDRLTELERYPDTPTPTNVELLQLARVLGMPIAFFSKPVDPEVWAGWIHGSGIEPCSICGYAADYLCDWPMGHGRTCDAALCEDHQGHQPNGADYCPAHLALLERWGTPPPPPPERPEKPPKPQPRGEQLLLPIPRPRR